MQRMESRRQAGGCWWCMAVVIVVGMVELAAASSSYSEFCAQPINMELCWFNNLNKLQSLHKRFLRFGRGDPFLRFGKRGTDIEDLHDEFLRFGRSAPTSDLLDLLSAESASLRKRRHASGDENQATILKRDARDVKDGGFLRFGRGNEGALETVLGNNKRSDLADVNGDREYIRFGRAPGQFPRWGKRYLRFGRAGSEGFLRFGKRSS